MNKKHWLFAVKPSLIFCISCMFVFASSLLGAAPKQNDTRMVYKLGDNFRWADKDYDHSDWETYDVETPVHHNGILWMRIPITIGSSYAIIFPKTLNITSLMSYECYLDGKLVLKNGVVSANKNGEVEGLRQARTIIPAHLLTEGRHVFSLRISQHFSIQRNPYYEHMNLLLKNLEIGDYKGGEQIRNFDKFIALSLSFVSLFIGVYFIILFLNDRTRIAYGFFAGLCFCIFVAEFCRDFIWLYNYPYSWDYHIWQVAIVAGNLFLFLMPASFVFMFDLKYKKWWFFLNIAVFFICLMFSNPEYYGVWIITGSIMISLLINIVAIINEKEIAWLSLFGLVICMVFFIAVSYDYFFIGFVVLIMLLLTRLIILQRKQREQLAQTKLQSVQLGAELLRKNIQPHFILNSLTSLMEWVETEPDKSVDFIAELAGEFRLFSEVVDLELIPIKKEIDICRKHLSIMAFRLNGDFKLHYQESEDQGETIPPAIFHSLLENAFSHNNYSNLQLDFELFLDKNDAETIWRLEVPLRTINQSGFEPVGVGFGTTYIESRLQQVYPDRWRIEAKQMRDNWVTYIHISN